MNAVCAALAGWKGKSAMDQFKQFDDMREASQRPMEIADLSLIARKVEIWADKNGMSKDSSSDLRNFTEGALADFFVSENLDTKLNALGEVFLGITILAKQCDLQIDNCAHIAYLERQTA